MSYQVIARKWRPGAFKEVVGQDHVVRTLSNAISSGRIGHAFIFSGPRGVGKTTVARILAKCLNCADGPTAEPCLKCSNCMAIKGGSLVDVLEIDGASNNGVENVREICEAVRYSPASARYKIYIIDEVHMLSTPAFNALLKTLEEPPPYVVFIFATTEPQKIPLTIHSRCQRFDFRRIPFKQINSHLSDIVAKEGIDATAEAVFMLAREADGSLRDAQSLLEQVISFSGKSLTEENVIDSLGLMDRSIIFELSEAVLGGDGPGVLNIVEKIHEFGYDFKKVTAELLEQVRDLVVTKVSGTALVDLPESELERLTAMAEQASLERLEMLFAFFTSGYGEVTRSTTPRFAFEMMLVRATLLEDLRPLGELIDRLEKLGSGKKIAGGRAGGEVRPRSAGASTRTVPEKSPEKAAPATSSFKPPVSSIPSAASVAPSAAPLDPSPKASPSDSPARASSSALTEASSESVPVRQAPSAKASSGASGDKTVSGLLQFAKAADTLIYNRLKATVLTLEGDSLKISADPGSVNFLQIIKKDALVGICRDYFGTNKRLNFEKKNNVEAATQEVRQEDTRQRNEPEPPPYEPGELESSAAEVMAEAAQNMPVTAPVTSEKNNNPEKGVEAESAAAPASKGDSVLKDTLSTLGGKVIDDRRITNV